MWLDERRVLRQLGRPRPRRGGAPEEIVDLAEVLSDHKEIDVAKHTTAGMLELQRQANNGVWEAKFSSMIEPVSEMAFMPSPAEVCNTLKLLEGSRDILWNTLMEVRRKQIVLDSMIVARQSENKEINSYAAAGDLSQAASTDTPTPLPTAKSSAGELTAHEDENQFSEAISNKTKAMYTMRQRQVYDLQVQNSLKVTESHIFSTISDEGVEPIAIPRSLSSSSFKSPNSTLNACDSSDTARDTYTQENKGHFDERIHRAIGLKSSLVSTVNKEGHLMTSSIDRFMLPPEQLAKKRALISVVIRERKLRTRRAWDVLADQYLAVKHYWDAHINEIEQEEEQQENAGPRLRGSFRGLRPSTDDSGGTLFAVLGQQESQGIFGRANNSNTLGGFGNGSGRGGDILGQRNSMTSHGGGAGGLAGGNAFGSPLLQPSYSDGDVEAIRNTVDMDKEREELTRKESLQRRIDRCTSKIPDMRRPWQWPDVELLQQSRRSA